ncbi:MAG: acetate--CoA ligase family protein [Candidatus Omnitrophota bacterium]|nr:acetate--CoA ligase family protein [Candidatus Omnitrophota bacterium]
MDKMDKINKDKVLALIEKHKDEKFIPEPVAEQILNFYSIPIPAGRLAKNAGQALSFAGKIGWPVVLKIVSPQIIHKSDSGGVITGINSAAELNKAFKKILKNVKAVDRKAKIEGVYVQKMVPVSREVIIGAINDQQFGAVVMFGLGGIFVELFKDVVFRIAPINKKQARKMVNDIKGLELLKGIRGEKPIDFDSLFTAISNVSRLIYDFPQIRELDVNPVCVSAKGICAIDARIILK